MKNAEKPKLKKYEVEICECGYISPIEFITYDENMIGTCPTCMIEFLQIQLKRKRKNEK